MGCEYCMTSEDVVDFCSRKIAVAALGYTFHSESRVHVVEIMPASKVDRHNNGEYGWEFVDAVYLLRNGAKSGTSITMIQMCEKYGVCNSFHEPADSSHEERIIAANELMQMLMSMPCTNSVYLTGSTALNSDRLDSDLDLLVILNECPGAKAHIEIEELGDKYTFPVEFFFMKEKEFLQFAGSGYSLFENRILISPVVAQRAAALATV